MLEFNSIEKYGIKLRLVELTDAEFILRLRIDEKLGAHISSTSPSLNDQIDWLKSYKEREKIGLEYYFITVDDNGTQLGTTRLSELDGDLFEQGSWLFDKNAPEGAAVKADIITKEIGYDILEFETGKFDVRKSNTKVLKYHKGYNPILVKENELNYYFNLNKNSFKIRRDKLIKLL